MFLHPTLDIDIIQQRQNCVAVFSRAHNQVALLQLSKSLSKIKDLKRILMMVHKGIEGGNPKASGIKSSVWSSLLDFCFHVINIIDTLTEINGFDDLQIHRKALNILSKAEFQRLGKIMFDVVDLEESQVQRRTVVKPGINEDLDRVKNAYNGMDEILQQAAIESVPELNLRQGMSIPALTVIYLPQLGFHVLMPVKEFESIVQQGIRPPWERMFRTEVSVYFKTTKTRRMDDELGDVWAIIVDIEIEITHSLAQKVLEREDFLVQASDLCGELDTLIALARGATEYNLRRPWMVKENIIEIRAGRHLLQEALTPHYVPNDAFRAGRGREEIDSADSERPEHPNMLLFTGPNFSGKSVYLKQIALIVYMAQVGSFVPVEAARLGITDKILTHITTRETVSKFHSSFMTELQQVSWALKGFTPRSLLVIDEFGKGTDSCDGAGLVAGVFDYLLTRGDQAPKVVASTHFYEIFEQDLLHENSPGLGLKQMEVKFFERVDKQKGKGNHNSEVTYLYNVRPDRSTLSFGAQCAAMNGVPANVVERACELTHLAMAGEDLVSACSCMPEEEIRDLEEAEAISKAFFELDLEDMEDADVEDFKGRLSDLIGNNSSTYTRKSSGGS